MPHHIYLPLYIYKYCAGMFYKDTENKKKGYP
jgi:hypothetical protein